MIKQTLETATKQTSGESVERLKEPILIEKQNRNRRNKTEMKGGENLRLNYNDLQMRIITEEIHSTSKSS
jgi:hypothetical protein